ncbi:hypothetical protein C7N43_15165 [Sphingobacteriales bacterium UPWRP_1]|nr:hypothetical protein BVG80_09015 [Sphingobacteriales bacterium TSM_CSM]PSJ76179.1 hypothetical protein C7N43_15165 [Sphingobacteriales bacterium UPWRP_1]
MCTLTYLPLNKHSFIATSNRDEQPGRAANGLTLTHNNNGVQLLYPKEPQAGGTWLATANDNRLACILNGAFERHHRNPPYRRSRGLLLLDYFDYPDTSDFLDNYDFTQIEPFTLVLYDKGNLTEMRWDGEMQYIQSLQPDLPYIWSSATLYTPEARALRNLWFTQWLNENHPFTVPQILQFHTTAGKDNATNGLVMNRFNMVKTISITSILKTATAFEWLYKDLVHERQSSQTLSLLPTQYAGAK